MTLFDRSILFAVKAHSGATRKGSKTPYIVHPLEVAAIAATLTSDEEVLAACVLHDTIEDTPVTAEELRREFGERVLSLVLSDTENKRETLPPAETWELRKQETLIALGHASKEQLIIVLSDKLSNMRSVFRGVQEEGDGFFDLFHVKDKAKHAWYYRGIAARLAPLQDSAAYREYVWLLEKVFSSPLNFMPCP